MYRDLTRDIVTPSLLARLLPKISITTEDACWEWSGARTPFGYGRIGVVDPVTDEWRVEYAHRIMAVIAKNADIPAGTVAMHLCDNPPCCNPSHINIGTPSENAQDRENKGRRSLPEGYRRTRLTHKQDQEIADLYQSGLSSTAIADRYSVSHAAILRAVRRRGVLVRSRHSMNGVSKMP